MELTEYVEEYMPDYVELLNNNPELKRLCTVEDEEGKTHYYALYVIADTAGEPFEGYAYRRDWVVEYAELTEYVWDWDSEYVKEHGHPAVTPLEEAQAAGNLEAFSKAIEAEGYSEDMFWKVNLNGFSQGMVGMQCLGIAFTGTTIRETSISDFGKERAMVFGASLPVNDKYGSDEQKFHDPDTFFQGSRITNKIGLTTKCEEKDLEALFAMLNWFCTEEGMRVTGWGLSQEQYESMEFDPDVYADLGVTNAYTTEDNGDGDLQRSYRVKQALHDAARLRYNDSVGVQGRHGREKAELQCTGAIEFVREGGCFAR